MRKLISETGAFFELLSVFSFAVAANVALAQNSQLDTEFLQADLFSLNQVPAVLATGHDRFEGQNRRGMKPFRSPSPIRT